MQDAIYQGLKARVQNAAESSAGCVDADARARGYLDVFHLLMTDPDGACQPKFLTALPLQIPDGTARRVLLDGMAVEYAGARGWMAYIQSEDWRR